MKKHRVCPVWLGYVLASPVRKLFESPEKIVGPYLRPGMTVLDVGCAMGFYTLPAARLVGRTGWVIAVDLQPGMIKALEKKARQAGLLEIIETRVCDERSLGLDELEKSVDFALASAVVHEVPDPAAFFSEIAAALKPGASLLVLEPKGHVSAAAFEKTVSIAAESGFATSDHPEVRRSWAALLHNRCSAA